MLIIKIALQRNQGCCFRRYIVIQDDRKSVVEDHENRLRGFVSPPIFETILLASDGEEMEVKVNAIVIYKQQILQYFLFIRDICLRKRHEEERRYQ